MNIEDIANAVSIRLDETPDLGTVVFENKDAPPALPYVSAEFVPASLTDISLQGGSQRFRGFMMVTVVSKQNEFASAARATMDKIIAQFPPRLALPFTGGQVLIGDAQPIRGYPDGATWRQPVRINFTATKA